MISTGDLSGAEHLHTELMKAIASALASGSHRDQDLLFLCQWIQEVGEAEAMARVRSVGSDAPDDTTEIRCQGLLRSLVCTPAHTPLGIAAKLAIACVMFDVFRIA